MHDIDSASVRRAIVQQLEGFRQAGLTHWTKIAPLPVETPAPVASATAGAARGPASSSSLATTATVRADVPPPPLTRAESMPPASRSVRSSSAVVPASATLPLASGCAMFQPLNLPRDERVSQLAVLAERVAACVRCQELAATRKQTVFGVGNPEAKIMFIGEAPGADEDAQGEPFVGRAGQLLNDIIKACRMQREDIYICNILRCRPPGNRLPSPEEAGNCREYLDGQIALVNPEYIVCWGTTAAKNLLASEATIGKLRRQFFQYGRAKVLCTYHPSYLLRNPAAKKDVWEDMKLLFRDMGVDLTAKT
ncbi:MAG: uracil-DNA glycosylase [Planctomycetota bacterium]